MKKIFRYTCASCEQMHEGAPSFSFNAPAEYDSTSSDKSQTLLSDFCCLPDSYYIRTILEIPIIGSDQPFLWGVWVSQSEENFKYYQEHFDDNLLGRETFGWFSNKIPYYKDTLNLKTKVLYQDNKDRPKLHLQESDHELSKDFHDGISMDKAIKIMGIAMHKNENSI